MTIAFYLPGLIPVYAFSLVLGAGASLGLGWAVLNADGRVFPTLGAALFALFGALVGSRVGFLAVNWGYYESHGGEILQLPWGGLSWGGALAGAGLALLVAVPVLQLSAPKILDSLFPLFALVGAAGWLGCWLDGCAYGPASGEWYALLSADEWGNLTGRVPLQLLAVALSVLTLLAFDLTRRRLAAPGLAGGLGLAALALQTWWLNGLRVDPAALWRGARLDLWAARFFMLGSALVLGAVWAARARRAPTPGTDRMPPPASN